MEVYFNLSIWEDTYKALFDHKYINFKIIKAPTAIRAPRDVYKRQEKNKTAHRPLMSTHSQNFGSGLSLIHIS